MKKYTIIFILLLLGTVISCTSQKEKELARENTKKINQAYIEVPSDIETLLIKNTCIACHDANRSKVGPSFKEIAKKGYTAEIIYKLIYKPNPNHWPNYPEMMVIEDLEKNDVSKIAKWIDSLD